MYYSIDRAERKVHVMVFMTTKRTSDFENENQLSPSSTASGHVKLPHIEIVMAPGCVNRLYLTQNVLTCQWDSLPNSVVSEQNLKQVQGSGVRCLPTRKRQQATSRGRRNRSYPAKLGKLDSKKRLMTGSG